MVKIEKIPVGYHATEAGILPVDWQVKRLNEVATELTDRAGQDLYETVSISAGIGFVNQAEKFGKEFSGKQYEKYIVLHKGDFSYNKGNSKTFPQGCIYRLNDRESAAVPNVFESFRIKEQNADYYEQLFLSGFLNKQLYSRINRGVRDDGLLNLTGKDFYSCMVPVPPKDEQKKIAEVLSCCDRKIDLKQQLIVELQRLKNGLLQAMFPAKGHSKPNVRFPGFTDAWEAHKLGEVVEFHNGDRSPRYPNDSDMVPEGIPFINAGDLVLGRVKLDTANKITEEKFNELSGAKIQRGDIIYCLRGTLGKNAFVDNFDTGTVASSLVDIRPKKIVGKYLFQVLNSDIEYRQRAVNDEGAAQPNLSVKNLSLFDIPMPNEAEQEKIAVYFERLDNLITLHQRELEEMKKQKKSLAKLLLIGRVRVPT